MEDNIYNKVACTPPQQILQQDKIESESRNYGIDFLKILSMFMVVILHVLGNGGVLSNCIPFSVSWYGAYFLEIASYGAVNCFAMATGYLMINKKYKTSRIIHLWVEVLLFSVMLSIARAIIYPENMGIKEWLKTFFPVTFNAFWYFSGYFALFFLMPFINKLLDILTERLTVVLIALLLIFSVVMGRVNTVFTTEGGYSLWWLIIMYLIGAYIKKYGFLQKLKARWCFLIYALGVIATLLSMPIISLVSSGYIMFFVSYISPTVLISSLALVLFCSKLKIKRKNTKNILKFMSSLSFGVYILQMQPLIYTDWMTDRFVFLATEPAYLLIIYSLLISMTIFLSCMIIVWLKSLLFKYCKIDKMLTKLGDKIDLKILK